MKFNSNHLSLSQATYQKVCDSYCQPKENSDKKTLFLKDVTARVTALALPILALLDSINYGIQSLAHKISPEKYPFNASHLFTKHLTLTGKFLLTAIPGFFYPAFLFRKEKDEKVVKSLSQVNPSTTRASTPNNSPFCTPLSTPLSTPFSTPTSSPSARSINIISKPPRNARPMRMRMNIVTPQVVKAPSPLEKMNADLDKHAGNEAFKDLWNILLLKKDLIKSWTCNENGAFTLELKDDLNFYMEDFPIDGTNPNLYQMGIFMGDKNKGILSVTGCINKKKKEIGFTQGLQVRVKQGRFAIPTIKFNEDDRFTIQGSVGFGYLSYTSNMSFDKASLKESWKHGEVIEGDEKAFLLRKYDEYAKAKETNTGKNPRFFLRDISRSKL